MDAQLLDLHLIIIALLLFALFFALVCVWLKKPEEEKMRYGKLQIGIFSLPHECGSITRTIKNKPQKLELSKGIAYKNKVLQKLVKTRVEKTPINTSVRITNFAWDILQDLEFCNLLPTGWEPVLALQHAGGICLVRYMKIPPKDGTPDTAYKDLYFSTEDGHVIYWKPSS